MEWVLASLIVGTMIYAGAIVIDYFNYSSQILPRIQGLSRQVDELGEAASTEDALLLATQDRIEALNESVAALQHDVAQRRGQIQAERQLKQRLEMAHLKQRLKSRRGAVAA